MKCEGGEQMPGVPAGCGTPALPVTWPLWASVFSHVERLSGFCGASASRVQGPCGLGRTLSASFAVWPNGHIFGLKIVRRLCLLPWCRVFASDQ